MISTRHIERIRGAFCDDALYRFTFTFTLEKKQATVKQIGKRKKIITLSASGDLSKRSVIFTEETVCGRERVTSDEEWVLEGGRQRSGWEDVFFLRLDCLHDHGTGPDLSCFSIYFLGRVFFNFSVCPVWWTKLVARQLFTAR